MRTTASMGVLFIACSCGDSIQKSPSVIDPREDTELTKLIARACSSDEGDRESAINGLHIRGPGVVADLLRELSLSGGRSWCGLYEILSHGNEEWYEKIIAYEGSPLEMEMVKAVLMSPEAIVHLKGMLSHSDDARVRAKAGGALYKWYQALGRFIGSVFTEEKWVNLVEEKKFDELKTEMFLRMIANASGPSKDWEAWWKTAAPSFMQLGPILAALAGDESQGRVATEAKLLDGSITSLGILTLGLFSESAVVRERCYELLARAGEGVRDIVPVLRYLQSAGDEPGRVRATALLRRFERR